MALSHEDKKDVAGAMGKALANKVSKVTRDHKASATFGDLGPRKPASKALKSYMHQDRKVARPVREKRMGRRAPVMGDLDTNGDMKAWGPKK